VKYYIQEIKNKIQNMKNIKFKKLEKGYILVNYNTFEQINPLQFNYVWDFDNGIAKVYKDDRGYNFINTQGELL